ncbi:MAG: hypothetical protein E7H33_09705 [Clostridium perfringens]|uniref:hypothetical protein n=1 Tax=Clostridium perfringens TaxID=1502 RepID=UPI00290CE388|nr:hypothetical protein [Clostridium perfringens]MDU4051179.1 hypothetical protein [Clostridium perfringens]
MMFQVGVKREIMTWLNMKEFGDLLSEFNTIEAAKDYINKKPKFIRSKLHIIEKNK